MTETIFRGALLLGAEMALSKKLPPARNGSRDGSPVQIDPNELKPSFLDYRIAYPGCGDLEWP